VQPDLVGGGNASAPLQQGIETRPMLRCEVIGREFEKTVRQLLVGHGVQNSTVCGGQLTGAVRWRPHRCKGPAAWRDIRGSRQTGLGPSSAGRLYLEPLPAGERAGERECRGAPALAAILPRRSSLPTLPRVRRR